MNNKAILHTCVEIVWKPKKGGLRNFDLLQSDRKTMSCMSHPWPDTMFLLISRKSKNNFSLETQLVGENTAAQVLCFLLTVKCFHRTHHHGIFAFPIKMSATSTYGKWWVHMFHEYLQQFPIATVTNCTNLLTQNNTTWFSYSSVGEQYETDLTELKLRWRQGWVPSGGSRGESVFQPLPPTFLDSSSNQLCWISLILICSPISLCLSFSASLFHL